MFELTEGHECVYDLEKLRSVQKTFEGMVRADSRSPTSRGAKAKRSTASSTSSISSAPIPHVDGGDTSLTGIWSDIFEFQNVGVDTLGLTIGMNYGLQELLPQSALDPEIPSLETQRTL